MFSVPKKASCHCASPTLCPDWSQGSRWVCCLCEKYFSMPRFLPARLKTELSAHGLPARKVGSATSKHDLGRSRPPVGSAQRSRRHFAHSAILVAAFRAVSPIGAFPARSCSTDPTARVVLRDSWSALSARDLIPTTEDENSTRQA